MLGLGEVTRQAAMALRDATLPGYRVESLDLSPRAQFEVALIYPSDAAFVSVLPFTASYVPRGTRSMAVIDLLHSGHRIRFIACHWTARFEDASARTRSDIARQLGHYLFDYFSGAGGEERHTVIMGDLNEEPFGLLERDLHAHRHHARATQSPHWRDVDVNRKYLYNLSWRFVGERRPFGPAPSGDHDSAGTYYHQGSWNTYDHLIVDGSLLSTPEPYLDESAARVVTHPLLFGGAPPKRFSWVAPGRFSGLSDHLPITAKLHL